jgi:hypothetical protein
MFYPTCYVYKIASNDDSPSSTETHSSNKKSDLSSTKKPKIPPSSNSQSTPTTNPPLDSISNNTKTDDTLIKNLSNQLLISAQRNNCIDLEKKYVESFVFSNNKF